MCRRAAGDAVSAHVDNLWPYSSITAGVLVLNGGKSGELSDTISFDTPEGCKLDGYCNTPVYQMW